MMITEVDPKVLCLGYPIYNSSLEDLPFKSKLLVNTINQYSYCIAEEDIEFKKALLGSDVILPDGIGITLAAKWLNGDSLKKIAGADFHEFQLKRLNENHGSCFYLGASSETLSKIEKRLQTDYPNIRFGSYAPPFKPQFTEEDNLNMIEAVNSFVPDVLFVGMTAPKQEKWTYAKKAELNAQIICSIGAVFDFYAGTIERPSKIWRDLGLEWLGRLVKEPKRMYKRYIYYGLIYVKCIMKAKFYPKYRVNREVR